MQVIVWTWMGWGMLALGGFGLVTSSVFLGMVLVGAARFRREAKRQDADAMCDGRSFCRR